MSSHVQTTYFKLEVFIIEGAVHPHLPHDCPLESVAPLIQYLTSWRQWNHHCCTCLYHHQGYMSQEVTDHALNPSLCSPLTQLIPGSDGGVEGADKGGE